MNGQELNNKTRLTLERRHQLIDLNKEYVNFDITFECKSVDATKDFEVIVVNQEQLNTIDLTNLTMKLTNNGYISGNIVADEDKYQNYFLILRSPTDEPIEVDLEIKIKQIDAKFPLEGQMPSNGMVPENPLMENGLPPPCADGSSISNTHKIFIVVGFLVIVGAVGYYFWKHRKDSGENSVSFADIGDDTCSVLSDGSAVSKSSSSSSSSGDEGVLQQLIRNKKA